MLSDELKQHLATIGRKGGKKYKPGSDKMRELASLSWTPRARAKRLRSKPNAKPSKQPKINNNNSIA